jgi:hypothetical protein
LLCPDRGKLVWLPTNVNYTPDVDLEVALSPAKSASLYKRTLRSEAASPIQPFILTPKLELM